MYQLLQSGVRRLSDNASIPNNLLNSDWRKYQEWLAKGNIPISIQPNEDHILENNEWVLDIAKRKFRQLSEKQVELKEKMLELFEFTFALFGILKTKGLVENTDFDIELRQKAAVWKQLLDEMDTLK